MSKKYARITQYGDLLVPMDMLEKIVANCLIVGTSYVDGKDLINKVSEIDRVSIHDSTEIDDAIVQQKLEEA